MLLPWVVKVLETSGTSKRWLHSFSAGVDGLIPGLNGIGLTNDDLLFSNGRGAFSDSLAEYAMAAILHFNKQVPRIQANRKARLYVVIPIILSTLEQLQALAI